LISRFPLKAAGGESLTNVRLGWHGLAGDRQYALLRSTELSGLPWVSARETPAIAAWRASRPLQGIVQVATPDGKSWKVKADSEGDRIQISRYASKTLGVPVSLLALWRGTFDSMSLSVISTASIHGLVQLVGQDIDIRRLRANLVISVDDAAPGVEQRWMGRELRLGDGGDAPVIRVDRTTTRCEVVDINVDTGVADVALFDVIKANLRNRLGVYATTVHPGVVIEGAPVLLR
jgi:uncharacterized protein YcbX